MSIDEALQGSPVDGSLLSASLGIDAGVLADVRAAGSILSAEVPRMVEDFYVWLVELPEFQQFFGDKVLLAHVKAQQTRYWQEFFEGQVGERYVAKRRLVGHTHANIGLGLLVYLKAMEFVSNWFVARVGSEPAWLERRASMTNSLRKLIEFDSAIVVETYAARTERLLSEQRARLQVVARVMHAVAEGDLTRELESVGPGDELGASVNQMVQSLKAVTRQMGVIARGDFSLGVTPRSEKDELVRALSAMTDALRDAAELKQHQVWMAQSHDGLREAMSGNPTVAELCDKVLSYLCRRLAAQVGAIYVADDDALVLGGTFAVLEGAGVPTRWKLGEGLVGQAGLERRRFMLDQVPESSLRVRWGLGEALPKSLVVLPLVHSEELKGVVELGCLSTFDQKQLDFLDTASTSVSQAITEAQARARIQQLLEASQAQAEELEAQQEELRQANEELEEHAQLLERERETVDVRNREIARAQLELEVKADELAAASQYKSEFLASMSHELRTPLNSLLILSKLLGDNVEGNLTPKQVEYAQTVHTSGSELLQLINEILDLSKIEAGKVELELVEFETAEFAGYLERSFRPLAEQKGLAFSVSVDERFPKQLETDVQRLQQVLKNLLSNAFKFTETGEVSVTLSPAGTGFTPDHSILTATEVVQFSVRDTGIGIAEAKKQQIFEAFRQADAGTSRKYGGTGLGLSISKEIVRLLGGEISVHSEPAKGSTFTVHLPVRHAGAKVALSRAPGEWPASPTATLASRSTVAAPSRRAELPQAVIADDRTNVVPGDSVLLIIEDDLRFAKILLDIARQRGFKAIVGTDGGTGILLAERFQPDALTLDINLPDISGWAVFDRLKSDPRTRHIPIHIITVDAERRRSMALGAVTHLEKPVQAEQLISTFEQVRSLLQRDVKQLLLVEDNETERRAIVELIGNGDVATTAVGTGAEALAAVAEKRFDCMVLDLGLPDMEGTDLIRQIQEQPASRDLPIIIYTGRELTRVEELALERATDAVIVKDVRSPERLLAETALFLHRVEANLPESQRQMIRQARACDELLAGRGVLIVDDDFRNIFALSSVLERQGMQVSFAESGQAALELLKQAKNQVSVILLDIMMPGMDGFDTMRAIRKLPNLDQVPIIAVTAKAMKGDREKCLKAGASDYISKPVDTDQLLSLLRVWLYQPVQRKSQAKPRAGA